MPVSISNGDTGSRTLLRNQALLEQGFRLLVQENPQAVYPQGGPKGKVHEVQNGQNNRQDLSPGPELQQADTGNKTRNGENRKSNNRDSSNESQYSRLASAALRTGKTHETAKYNQYHQRRQDSHSAEHNV